MTKLKRTVLERFLNKCVPEPNSGCWLWLEGVGNGGYGTMSAYGKWYGAHRLAYELFVGYIPEGMDLDHLCRVRACVNPAHLEPVTRKVNLSRGLGAARSHCPNGHEYNHENAYFRANGKKQCRLCARVLDRKRYPARRLKLELSRDLGSKESLTSIPC